MIEEHAKPGILIIDDHIVKDIDKECIALCDAINLYNPQIRTVESCCGHGKRTYKIWLHIEGEEGLDKLPKILYFLDVCHNGRPGWSCEVYTDCGMSPITWKIQGPIGDQAYDDAKYIAGLIRGHFEETTAKG